MTWNKRRFCKLFCLVVTRISTALVHMFGGDLKALEQAMPSICMFLIQFDLPSRKSGCKSIFRMSNIDIRHRI